MYPARSQKKNLVTSLSQVKHTLTQPLPHATTPQLLGLPINRLLCTAPTRSRPAINSLQQLVNIASPPLAREIRIICRRHQTNCLGRPCEHIADIVRQFLQRIGTEFDFVVHDIVMGWPRRSLQSAVCLEKEVEIVDGSDAAVDDRAWTGITISVGVVGVGGIEARMMTFATYDNGELRTIHLSWSIVARECFDELRHLLRDDYGELTLRRMSAYDKISLISASN